MATKIRYVNSGDGLIVRSTAAGTRITSLSYGSLMYDIPNVSKTYASLGGINYEWIKVHYYQPSDDTEGEGWVASPFTTT